MLSLVNLEKIISEIKEIISAREYKTDRPLYYIKTYGCQMNEHDSETISSLLIRMGFVRANSEEEADFVVLNTCDIRENADNRFFGNLGILKARKAKDKGLMVAVCGCMMQRISVVNKIKNTFPFVDVIFGTHNIYKFPELLLNSLKKGRKYGYEVLEDNSDIFEGLEHDRLLPHKALVNITFGCDNFCTFCIVPYTRGREKSRERNMILDEVRELVREGVKEIFLLGQNVNSYGKTLYPDYGFSHLLEDIAGIEGDFRIRFMTPHPKDFSDRLIDVIANNDKIMNSVHLPLQAASNKLLKRMNRRYTKETYLELVSKIKDRIPDVSISTDLIIGFPGETDEDIAALIDLIREVRFDNAYTFIYSPREGTPAAKFDDQIPEELKNERFSQMLKVLNDIIIEKNAALVGQTFEVLADSFNDGVLNGKTPCFRSVHFEGSEDLIGKLVNVKITEAKKFSLSGALI